MADNETNDDEHAGRAAVELKETEDLLAGFDRPGRTPRVPPVTRDFVDYHLEKRRSNPELPSAKVEREAERGARDLPTAIIPAKRRRFPAWLPWAALLGSMSVGGVVVAASMIDPPDDGRARTSSTATGYLPSAATTIASGTAMVGRTSSPERDIPSPPPSTEAPSTTMNTASAATTAPSEPAPPTTQRRAPTSGSAAPSPSGLAAPAASTPPPPASAKPAPDVDLIRNL